MAIKGLQKGARKKAEQKAKEAIDPQEFIEGANKRTNKTVGNGRQRVYKTATFSLNQECDQDINNLTYIPRDFKISRSGVIKAAIDFLKNQPLEKKLECLRKYRD